jgi:peptidylprolyl isomerase
VRRTSALVSSVAVVAVLSAALVGCAASPDDASACTPALPAGSASELVTATGEVGAVPKVEIPAPLVSKGSQRSVLEAGDGLVAQQGMTVDFDAAIYDGEDGASLLTTKFDGTQGVRFRAGLKTSEQLEHVGALSQALVCAQPGQRIALTTSAGASGLDLSSVGITDEDHTIVMVVDVQEVFLGKADGVNQLPQDGMPVVVTAPAGTVGITVPSGIHVPSGDRTEVVKLGSGAKLAKDDLAVLQVANWTWPAGDDAEVSQKSTTWKVGGTPTTIALTDEGDQALPAVLLDALIGLPVGSQVLTVVAPTGDSTDATIFVIDVVGIQTFPATK